MNHDEATETCLSQADLDALYAEFNRASTEALDLVRPDTQPMGILLPFPGPRRDDLELPRRRDVRAPIRWTGRGLATFAVLAGAIGGALGGVIW